MFGLWKINGAHIIALGGGKLHVREAKWFRFPRCKGREILGLWRGGLVAPLPRRDQVRLVEVLPPVPALFPPLDDLHLGRMRVTPLVVPRKPIMSCLFLEYFKPEGKSWS